LQRTQKSRGEDKIVVAYLDLDEVDGEAVGEGDAAQGLQAVPDLVRGGDDGTDETAHDDADGCNCKQLHRLSTCVSN